MRANPRQAARRTDPTWRSKRLLAGLLLCGALLSGMTGSPSSHAPQPPRFTVSATVAVPFADPDQLHTALHAGRSLALLSAARQASGHTAGLTATRLALEESGELEALPVTAFSVLSAETILPDNTVRATADMFLPHGALADRVQEALSKDDLELKAQALRRMEPLAREAERLLNSGQNNDANQAAIRQIGNSLAALNGYFDLLDSPSILNDPQILATRLSSLIEQDPGNALLLLSLAETFLLLDRPHQALEAIDPVLRREPDLARGFYVRGLTQLRLRLPALAVADFSRALALRGDKVEWLRARAAALRVQHDYEPMCLDLYQICILDDCSGLQEMRRQGLCLEDASGAEPSGAEPSAGIFSHESDAPPML